MEKTLEENTLNNLDDKGLSSLIPQKNKIKNKILFLSQMIWFFYIFIFILLGFIFPRYHPSQTFISQNETKKFDKYEEPLIFSHVSDIHLTETMPERTKEIKDLLKYIKNYKVNFNLFTGDLVHNYKTKLFPKVGYQVYEDWELYKKTLNEEFKNENIIDVQGNHDAWAIDELFSKENYYLNYSFIFNRSNVKNEDDYFIKTLKVYNMNFILINNYRYPIAHPPYNFYAHPNKNQLDKIEKIISETKDAIIVSHYPVDYNWGIESSNKKSFEEIMKNPNIKYMYTGHLHPRDTIIIHHGHGAVEYIAMALKDHGFGLITIDNGRHVYNTIKPFKNKQYIFITHPIPLYDISDHQIFNLKDFPIRVISYYENEIDIFVKGDFNGRLNLIKKMKNGAYLYQLDVHCEKNGIYNIEVYNNDTKYNFSFKRKFYIGEQYTNEKEVTIKLQRGYNFLRGTIFIFYLCLFIILFPINGYYIDSIDTLINDENNYILDKIQWIYILFFSPLIMRYRIQESSKLLRTYLFIFLLLILIIPMHFFKPINNKLGFSFIFYIYIGGKFQYDRWCVQFVYIYIFGIIFPAMNYTSTLKYKDTWVHKFNIYFMYILLFAVSIVVNIRWVGESVIIPFLILNPIYVIFPLIIQYLFFSQRKNSSNLEKNEIFYPLIGK